MALNKFLHLALFVALMIASIQKVSAISCWICTSEAPFCDDPFDESNISDSERRWSYIECTPPVHAHDQKAVCKKIVQIVNDKSIISRQCAWESIFASPDECSNQNTPNSIVTIDFCETCDSDGCNGAMQNGAAAILVAISAILTKFYLL